MEFNQGKPLTEASIAGEKGAIFDTDSIALKFAYFDGAKGVWDSSPVGILEKSRGDMFDNRILSTCRWATLADLTAAGLTEAEALPMLHESQRPGAQPATAESARDIDIGDGIDPQQRMLDRDNAGMSKAEPVPVFELVLEPEEAPGLLVVAPLDRIGGGKWGL